MLPDWEKGSYKSHKSACTFLNLLFVGVIFLFSLVTRVNLLFIYKVHNLSNTLLLLMLNFIWCVEHKYTSSNICYYAKVGFAWELSLESSEFSDSTNTFVELYSFVGPRLMLFINLEALTTSALLIWTNC